jgi:hypothetical protein
MVIGINRYFYIAAVFILTFICIVRLHAAEEKAVKGGVIVIKPESKNKLPSIKPGDTVIFKAGKYKKKFRFENLKGTREQPIVIRPEKPGTVIFDGAEPIKLEWKKDKGLVFKAASDVHPHALQLNGRFIIHSKVRKGFKVVSARNNPNGNGIDLEPPERIVNRVYHNIWYRMDGKPFTVFHAPHTEKIAAGNADLNKLKAGNPAWGYGTSLKKPEFKDEKKYDFRTDKKDIGASYETLSWAKEQIRKIEKAK